MSAIREGRGGLEGKGGETAGYGIGLSTMGLINRQVVGSAAAAPASQVVGAGRRVGGTYRVALPPHWLRQVAVST